MSETSGCVPHVNFFNIAQNTEDILCKTSTYFLKNKVDIMAACAFM